MTQPIADVPQHIDDKGAISGVFSSDGLIIFPDSLAHTLGYNSSGQLITDTVVDPISGNTYVMTMTYTGSNLTGTSQWVKQ